MRARAAAEVGELAASALASELLGDVVVVDLGTSDGVDLDGLRALPRVVIGVGAGAHPAVDVAVEDPDDADRLVAAVRATPIAATSLVVLLRASEHATVDAGLVLESATYSVLQAGPEHAAWLASRARREPRQSDGGDRVRVSRDGGRATIELTRPDVRNAVDPQMQQAIVDAFATTDDAAEIVLRGAGPVFSAGGDLDSFGTLADPASAHLLRLTRSPARAIARAAHRTTAIVHGACHGAGVELPAFAGRVVARPDATFTLPEIGLGLVPGAGGTVSIPRRIGRQRTAWLALTAAPIDAHTALAWGLVDEVHEDAI